MPLINPKVKVKRQVVRLNLDENILIAIQKYCEWASIDKLEDFVEGAAEFAMKRDKAWLKAHNIKSL